MSSSEVSTPLNGLSMPDSAVRTLWPDYVDSFSCTTFNASERSEDSALGYGKTRYDREARPIYDFELQAQETLNKYFGYYSLKSFQLEALKAWAANEDCLILAATGSGKSLCFQLPALLTGKVVVVVSPLISLMHDQCLQLSRKGIAACFLGSGQSDKNVEKQAIAGTYSIVYVCPETLPRLICSFKQLACSRGITLFAIDEAHCISKWGHDFRLDYRRLSILRETFRAEALEGLEHDIPIMALTATATNAVQSDILDSLKFDSTSRIVRTTLFRQNLRFSVKHSKTSRPSSFAKDFKDLIQFYGLDSGQEPPKAVGNSRFCASKATSNGAQQNEEAPDRMVDNADSYKCPEASDSMDDLDESMDAENFDSEEEREILGVGMGSADGSEKLTESSMQGEEYQELTVEYLEDENEEEVERLGGDFDVVVGNEAPSEGFNDNSLHGPGASDTRSIEMGKGPSIVYVPTRKETETLAKFFCNHGLKAAAYHAKLPKTLLRTVHQQFHNGSLQVVVATIAFGMGIDKPNVRYIIHYGWPQSLEAYYQEAGRAGRDGLHSECMLYCDMTVLPSLLPSRRDLEQTRHAVYMLEQCFRYGLSTTKCRASILLGYFGEEISNARCNICDVCTLGPPPMEDLTKEAELLLTALLESQEASVIPCKQKPLISAPRKKHANMNKREHLFREAVDKICTSSRVSFRNRLWWRGFGRILVDIGFLREPGNLDRDSRKKLTVHCLRNPEVTVEGCTFLQNCNSFNWRVNDYSVTEERKPLTLPPLNLFPEGDMVQAMVEPTGSKERSAAWGRGWADPSIRRQRLANFKRLGRKPRQRRRPRNRAGSRRQRFSGYS